MRGFVMGAAIDPWSDGKLCNPKDHWDNNSDGCPLGYISELLLNWPDNTPTVDLEPAKKMERLVSIILGYPRISRGMYPLDWPTHPESIKALKLSLFFDSIKCSRFNNWSLRTSVLMLYNYYKEKIPDVEDRKIIDWILTISSMVFDSIRKNDGNSDLAIDNLTIGEMRFTSAMHSSSGGAAKVWRVGKKNFKRVQNYDGSPLTEGKGNKEIRQILSKPTHSFKVSKIQTWIENVTGIYADKYPIWPNLRQNMLAGCSTIIESIFAKLRHTIVKKYGASSIIIDGGGRISFSSSISSEVIKKEILEEIYTTFMLDESYEHPFNNIVKKTAEEEAENRNDGKKGRELFDELIGKDVCKSFFPPISYNNDDTDLSYTPYCENDCELCRPDLNPEAEYLDYKTKKWKNRVCFPHKLTYNIGLSAKSRDISWRSKGSTKNFNPETMTQIHSIAVFDLNSLGFMFKRKDDTIEEHITKIRKSFRFNALWWNVISNALNDDKVGYARLNCWIAAGDDITLVMRYGDENINLIKILEKIDINLKKSFKNFDVKFSFGAGLIKKADNEKILHTLRRARKAEEKAKLHWKYRAKKYHPELIETTDKDGNLKQKEAREIEGAIVLNDDIIDSNDAHKSIVYNLEVEEE